MARHSKSPVLYFPHGAGPLPLFADDDHRAMVEFLERVTPSLGTPSAILVISAHWEESTPSVTSNPFPRLIYDYYGFPEESYRIAYPAPGSPELAERIVGLLNASGFHARADAERGFDHGLFVPLKIMYPDAHIPCIQLSLIDTLDPAEHLRIGRALEPLRDQNILVVGSGFSFHNMRAFFSSRPGMGDAGNELFQEWLIDTCTNAAMTREERERRLIDWESAPSARYCHPREEHLLPLHVCCGLAGEPASLVFDAQVIGKRSIGLLW